MPNDDIDDIENPKVVIYLAIFVIGILIGSSIVSYYYSKTEYKNPSEVADELEKLLFNYSHADPLLHNMADRLILDDDTTLRSIKYWYTLYRPQARHLLEMQISEICYQREWTH